MPAQRGKNRNLLEDFSNFGPAVRPPFVVRVKGEQPVRPKNLYRRTYDERFGYDFPFH